MLDHLPADTESCVQEKESLPAEHDRSIPGTVLRNDSVPLEIGRQGGRAAIDLRSTQGGQVISRAALVGSLALSQASMWLPLNVA